MKRAKHTAGNLVIALNADLMSGDPHANLAQLEAAARDSIAFGPALRFDDDGWEIQSPTANRERCRLWFTVHSDDGVAKRAASRPRLKEPFSTFLKSVIRLSEAAKHKKASSHEAMLRAGRYLYDQLERRKYDPAELTDRDFQQAEMAAKQRDNEPWSYFAASQGLLKLATVVQKYRLSKAYIAYRPSTQAPDYDHLRVDVGMDPAMLPSDAALRALPKIAQDLKDESDICMMRAIELLHCAPWRIGELLSLPEACEVVTSLDGKLLTVAELEGGMPVRYGLRYRPEKSPGLTSDIKWIPSAAIPLARRALADLRKHTAQARDVAAYMEDNPGKAWLPARFRKHERLTLDDVAGILECSRKAAYVWVHSNKISIRPEHVLRDDFEEGLSTTLSAKANEKALIDSARRLLFENPTSTRIQITLLKQVIRVRDIHRWLRVKQIPVQPDSIARADLEARFLSMNRDVSPDFPWKLSECLFVFPKQFFSKRRSLLPVVSLMKSSQLGYFLTGNADASSIFERQGYTEDNGDPIHVTSHMFRRWLATLAMSREMSGAEVQNWLGHGAEGHAAAYDYRTPDTLGQEARKALGDGFGIGPIADIARSFKSPRDRDTFLETVLATAHITEYGMCARDWLSNPCVRHGACAACEKQLIRKGDPEHRQSIARNLHENRILLAHASAEAKDGQRGAANHARHLAREIAALEATMAIHDDPSIADGTYVQLDLPAIYANSKVEA
jgi:hypothetical protein